MSSLLGNLHPKVKWPLIFNAAVTAVLAIIAAATKGDKNAIVGAVVSLGMTILGAVTGYTVSGPDSSSGLLATTLDPSSSGIAPPSTIPGGAAPTGLNYPPIPDIPPIGGTTKT